MPDEGITMQGLTRRQEDVLAAISAIPGVNLAPVQVQKLFFLLDENIDRDLGGKQFHFEPYDYGPFDKAVYQELDFLKQKGLVSMTHIAPGPGGRRYALTPSGFEFGVERLGGMPPNVSAFMAEALNWVSGLSFAELVGSIYKAFPHMRAKSIFIE